MGDGLHVSWKDHSDNEDHFVVERHEGSGTSFQHAERGMMGHLHVVE